MVPCHHSEAVVARPVYKASGDRLYADTVVMTDSTAARETRLRSGLSVWRPNTTTSCTSLGRQATCLSFARWIL